MRAITALLEPTATLVDVSAQMERLIATQVIFGKAPLASDHTSLMPKVTAMKLAGLPGAVICHAIGRQLGLLIDRIDAQGTPGKRDAEAVRELLEGLAYFGVLPQAHGTRCQGCIHHPQHGPGNASAGLAARPQFHPALRGDHRPAAASLSR